MSQEIIFSLIRQLLLVGGGITVKAGWTDEPTMTSMVGALMILIVSGWGIYARRRDSLIASVAARPEVSRIVTTDEIAQRLHNDTVVSYEAAKNTSPPPPRGA